MEINCVFALAGFGTQQNQKAREKTIPSRATMKPLFSISSSFFEQTIHG
jgi:hypothetical protein